MLLTSTLPFALALVTATVDPPPPPPALPVAPSVKAEEPLAPDVRWSWVALPIFSLNVDEGAGIGVVAAIYRFKNERLRDDISFRGSVTTQLVQRYELRWTGYDAFDLPLRIAVRGGFYATLTRTYCGVGSGVTCDVADAESAALGAGFHRGTKPFDDFVRHYYEARFMRPYGDSVVRWRIIDRPTPDGADVELFGGARLGWTIPGDILGKRGPYPGSLYALAHPDGEAGPTGVLQAGVTVDTRDTEWLPQRGWFFESSLRGSVVSPTGHQYAGANAALTGYLDLNKAAHAPLWSTPHFQLPLTFVDRVMLDGMVGDVVTEEMALTGGVYEEPAFGGQWIGRGIRDYRDNGKLRVIEQAELRSTMFHFGVWGRHIDAGLGVFGDAAWIGADAEDLIGTAPHSPYLVVWGAGVGVHALIDHAILVRVDVAASPFEQQFPSFYTPVGYPF